MTAAQGRHPAILAIVWGALILAPYWMPLFGGYTALGSRVLVLGLGAMAVNFLLGFTGVLSFGHAAWFGLGAYACGLALKFVALEHPARTCRRHARRRHRRRHPRRVCWSAAAAFTSRW